VGYVYGSGITLLNSSAEISYCSITGNGANNSIGGGVYCNSGCTAIISHCIITGNIAHTGGGIFVAAGGNPTISNSTISDNIAYNGGGIQFSNGSSGTITDCIINADSTTNESNAKGGGILISSSVGDFTISNSTISNCWSAYGGSGLHIDDAASVLITGSTFDSNICSYSLDFEVGAIYSVNCDSLVIDHCDLVKNYSFWFAGGITLNGSTNLFLTNSIFRSQHESDITFASYSSASVSYCNFYGSASGPFVMPPAGLGTQVQTNANGDSCDVFYNIYLDPIFIDFAGGDYHLTENSPCIDAGNPNSPLDPDNTVTDMGVYYFHQSGSHIQPGNVSGIWTATNSPYLIHGDITIHADSTLIIEPGVEVIFSGDYEFTVNGTLNAEGTLSDSIFFTAADTGLGWQGINIDNPTDSIRISYSIIEYSNSSGIECDNSALLISNTNLRNNSGGLGGGLSVLFSYCRIHECEFSYNSGGLGGGLGFADACSISLTGSVFQYNEATSAGGAIWKGVNEISVDINNCEFISNTSGYNGGGICFPSLNQSILLSDLVFEKNVANENGGGVYISTGYTVEFSNCTFINDSALIDLYLDYGGGGVHCSGGGNFVFRDCEFNDNYTLTSGGAIFSDDVDRLMIYDSDFTGNVAVSAGAVWGYRTQYLAEVTNSNFELNQGGVGVSGVVHLEADTSILSNLTVVNNVDGGVTLASSYNTIRNCTFSGNNPRALTLHGGNKVIVNSIFEGNTGDYAVNQPGGINISYSDFYNNPAGHVGNAPPGFGTPDTTNYNGDSCDVFYNIFMDPLFADTTNNDFNLSWSNWPISDSTRSPAIDAGDPTTPNDPDNTVSDMGAFYFNQLRPAISISNNILDFGEVTIGNSRDLPLKIYNGGNDTLIISSVNSDSSVFTNNFNPANGSILPNDSLLVTVTFTPVDSGLINDTLFIINNDKLVKVNLNGIGKNPTGIIDEDSNFPKEYALYPAYPNPFNSTTTLKFDLPKYSLVDLKIYNILGEEVNTVILKGMNAGRYKYIWNADNLASGVYFYRLNAGEYNEVRKIIFVR
jgi:parallel beta-helix repeat protein/predicted outer membrane repeat protein